MEGTLYDPVGIDVASSIPENEHYVLGVAWRLSRRIQYGKRRKCDTNSARGYCGCRAR